MQKSNLLQNFDLEANAVDECTVVSAVKFPVSSFHTNMPNRVYC